MKYIRTKDGIFDITGKIIKNTYYGLKQNEIYIGCEYKQANTIEELCDEFVIKYESKDKVSLFDICNNFEATKEEYNNYQNEYKNANIYGAIWTDKGLIYVAKMNDKGELELL